jgi:hypothetical protein
MLIFIKPSFAFSMPIRPTRFGPRVGVMLRLMLPPLLERSPFDCPPIDVSLFLLAVPQRLPSRCAGDCDMIGLLWTLRPGLTARRLIEVSSKSSSRRRLFDFLSPSTAVGGYIGPGVEAREAHPIPLCWSCGLPWDDEMVGESMLMSSLTADDSARGKAGGGGVWVPRWFQKSVPTELRPFECSDPNVPNKPLVVEPSRLMLPSLSSSGTPSNGPSRSETEGNRLGDDCAVPEGPSSASRTCRMISASRRTSLSTGADSSKSSALMRPNCLDLG